MGSDYFSMQNLKSTYKWLHDEITLEFPTFDHDAIHQEMIKRAKYCFIMGLDSDFDYSSIDDNIYYDDIEMENQILQDEWFR